MRRTAGPEFRRPGHIGHLCFGDPDDLQIISVWQNRETWDRYFSELIQPIAEELGIDFGNQTVYEAYHLRLASESLVAVAPGSASEPGPRRRAFLGLVSPPVPHRLARIVTGHRSLGGVVQ